MSKGRYFFEVPDAVNLSHWWRYDMDRALSFTGFGSDKYLDLKGDWQEVINQLEPSDVILTNNTNRPWIEKHQAYFLHICDNYHKYFNHQKEISCFIDDCLCPKGKLIFFKSQKIIA